MVLIYIFFFSFHYLHIITNIKILDEKSIFLYVLDKKILTMFKQLLPHLIPPKTMKKINGVCKRASIYAAEKCMIRIVKVCILRKLNFYNLFY